MLAIRFSLIPLTAFAILVAGCGRAEQKAQKQPAPRKGNYTLGDVVSFARGGGSDRYKRGGWGDTEKDCTWTNARSAKLTFSLVDADQPLRLRMRLAGFTNPPALSSQPVEVLVNDESIAEWEVTSDVADFIALIPAEVANHEQLNIRFRIPEAASPKVLGVGDDPRLLGICCYELAITRPDAEEARAAIDHYEAHDQAQSRAKRYPYGTVVNLGLGGGGQRYKAWGWYPPEPRATWTGKHPAVLEFTVEPTQRPLELKMKLAGLTQPEILPAQPTEVYANSQKVADWFVGAPAVFEATIPSSVAKGGRLWVELRTPKATSPKQLKIGPETRLLGVACEALTIAEAETTEAEEAHPPAVNHSARK